VSWRDEVGIIKAQSTDDEHHGHGSRWRYYIVPNVEQPFRFITPGSVLAVIIWILASLGFSYYVSNFGSYGATYGSLGAVVVLLFYFFISSAVLLLGAEVNAEVYHARQDERVQERGAETSGRGQRISA
jgi:membrane protein